MTGSHPLVSIIIPCYNAEPWVAEAIDSCLAQTYHPIEIIVVDDGSTDGSLKIIQSYGDRIQYITGPNRGGCAARNQGFALSKGEFVMFLDADDYLQANTIEALVSTLLGHANSFAYCNWWRVLEVNETWIPVTYTNERLSNDDHILGMLTQQCNFISPLWCKNTITMLGGWDECLTSSQDIDLKYRALLAGVQPIHTGDKGAYYYRGYRATSLKYNTSVSNDIRRDKIISNVRAIQKLYHALEDQNKLEHYRIILGKIFYGLADACFVVDERYKAYECLETAFNLAGKNAITGSFLARLTGFTIGLEWKERIIRFLYKFGIATKQRKLTMIRLKSQ